MSEQSVRKNGEICITIKNYRCFDEANPLVLNLKPGFTALIGPNNAGKSTVLRAFFEFKQLYKYLARARHLDEFTNNIDKKMPDFGTLFKNIFNDKNKRNLTLEINIHNDSPLKINFRKDRFYSEFAASLIEEIKEINDISYKIEVDRQFQSQCSLKVNQKKYEEINFLGDEIPPEIFWELRRCFEILGSILYIPAYRFPINIGGENGYLEAKIGAKFVDLIDKLKTGENKSESEIFHRIKIDLERILSIKDLEVNVSSKSREVLLMIDGYRYNMDECGAGIGQFILTLANAASVNPSYIFIDEPESNLHPTLQLDFLTTLASYAQDGVVFSTHSLGLARASGADIYTVVKYQNGSSRIQKFKDTPQLGELLGELSFGSYRELGCRQVLLVEGSSDIPVFHHFLRISGKANQVAIISLGGADGIRSKCAEQLEEILRMSSNVSVIIDSEKLSHDDAIEKSREDFLHVCEKLNIKHLILERRATENYFSENAIENVLGMSNKALGSYGKCTWKKSEYSWRIANKMTFSDIKDTDLGRFLKSL